MTRGCGAHGTLGRPSRRRPCAAAWQPAHWLNAGASVEVRAKTGFLLRVYAGGAHLLNLDEGVCNQDYNYGAEWCRDQDAAYGGLALGYAFDLSTGPHKFVSRSGLTALPPLAGGVPSVARGGGRLLRGSPLGAARHSPRSRGEMKPRGSRD